MCKKSVVGGINEKQIHVLLIRGRKEVARTSVSRICFDVNRHFYVFETKKKKKKQIKKANKQKAKDKTKNKRPCNFNPGTLNITNKR